MADYTSGVLKKQKKREKEGTPQDFPTPVTTGARKTLEDATSPPPPAPNLYDAEPELLAKQTATQGGIDAMAKSMYDNRHSLTTEQVERALRGVPEDKQADLVRALQALRAPKPVAKVAEDIALAGDLIGALANDRAAAIRMLRAPGNLDLAASAARRNPQVKRSLLSRLPQGYATALIAKINTPE